MSVVTRGSMDALGGGAFRVGLRILDPTGWAEQPVLHGIGLALLILGLVALALYLWVPDADAWGVVEEFPLWTMAAWLFFLTGLGAAFRLTGHVVELGLDGISWRFLLALRAHPLDRTVAILALVGALMCSLASYGHGSHHRYLRGPVSDRESEDEMAQETDGVTGSQQGVSDGPELSLN